MASTAPAGPDAFAEKKRDDSQNNLETASSTDIEPALPTYAPADEQKDGSEEINYHTLTWWYVHPDSRRTIEPHISDIYS